MNLPLYILADNMFLAAYAVGVLVSCIPLLDGLYFHLLWQWTWLFNIVVRPVARSVTRS